MPESTPSRRSRSIMDIIDAVERSKSLWQSRSPLTSLSDNNDVSSFSQKLPVVARSEAISNDQGNPSNMALPQLPQPPPPSASRQEHHRYFYALRKATRQRKQQMAATTTPLIVTSMPSAVNDAVFNAVEPVPTSSTSSVKPAIEFYAERKRPLSCSSSSSLSPTVCRASSSISSSSVSTSAPDLVNFAPPPKTSYAAVLAAWQRTPVNQVSSHALILRNPDVNDDESNSLSDLLIDDDRKEIERLFDELTASLYLQHAELLS